MRVLSILLLFSSTAICQGNFGINFGINDDNFGSIKDYDNPKFQLNFGPTGKA